MPSAPTIKAIIDRIETELNAVRKQAGKILRRPRNTVYEDDFTEAFIDDDAVLRATVIFDPIVREREDDATRKYWLSHDIDLVHYLVKSDQEDSDRGFRKEIEAIRNRFRGNASVFGIPNLPEHQRTITEVTSDIVMFRDKLVHEARMRLVVEAEEVVT